MSGHDVFDAEGNYVGKFIPAGDGGEAMGLLGLIVVIPILGFFVLATIALVRMTAEGFKAIADGNWKKAMSFFVLPVFVLTCPVVGFLDLGLPLWLAQSTSPILSLTLSIVFFVFFVATSALEVWLLAKAFKMLKPLGI